MELRMKSIWVDRLILVGLLIVILVGALYLKDFKREALTCLENPVQFQVNKYSEENMMCICSAPDIESIIYTSNLEYNTSNIPNP